MWHFSSLFRELPLLKLTFKLDIWFQNSKFTMNSYYPKLGDKSVVAEFGISYPYLVDYGGDRIRIEASVALILHNLLS